MAAYDINVIVWAADGSPASDRAFEAVSAIADRGVERVVAVHVDEIGIGRGGAHEVYVDEDVRITAIERRLAEMRQAGIGAELRTAKARGGGVAHTIVETADEVHADLIVGYAWTWHGCGAACRERYAQAAAHRSLPGARRARRAQRLA